MVKYGTMGGLYLSILIKGTTGKGGTGTNRGSNAGKLILVIPGRTMERRGEHKGDCWVDPGKLSWAVGSS